MGVAGLITVMAKDSQGNSEGETHSFVSMELRDLLGSSVSATSTHKTHGAH